VHTSGSHSRSPRRDTSSVRMGRTLGGSSQGACAVAGRWQAVVRIVSTALRIRRRLPFFFFLESIIYRLRNTLNGNRPSWSFDPGPAQPPSGG
jgi:hypothetical protein